MKKNVICESDGSYLDLSRIFYSAGMDNKFA